MPYIKFYEINYENICEYFQLNEDEINLIENVSINEEWNLKKIYWFYK